MIPRHGLCCGQICVVMLQADWFNITYRNMSKMEREPQTLICITEISFYHMMYKMPFHSRPRVGEDNASQAVQGSVTIQMMICLLASSIML